MFNAKRLGTPGICVGVEVNCWPRTSSRLDAGSVLTSSTLRPRSARAMAEAQARDVFPTPPLPVKKRKREGASRKAQKESAGFGIDSVFMVGVVILRTLPADRTLHRQAECPRRLGLPPRLSAL